MGDIVTFYSFKGGVGRTMALANVGVLMAQWGYKILIIDWDLEAPGLERYFANHTDTNLITENIGLVDLFSEYSSGQQKIPIQNEWKKLVQTLPIVNSQTSIDFISAGRKNKNYYNKLRAFNIEKFYNDRNGGLIIEDLRKEIKEDYDFVLLDSRTGITDVGGICTVQLPDFIVLMFTANQQSLEGIIDVSKRIDQARQNFPFSRFRLLKIPIPGKFDTQTEFEISKGWFEKFEYELKDIYNDWLPESVSKLKLLEMTKIPYIPYFSFGEKLPVIEQGTNNPTGIGFAYETLAALITNKLRATEVLLSNRDEFLKIAIGQKDKVQKVQVPSVLLDFHQKDIMHSIKIIEYFNSNNIRTLLNPTESTPLQNISSLVKNLRQVHSLVFIFDRVSEDWLKYRLAEMIKIILMEEAPIRNIYLLLFQPFNAVFEENFMNTLFNIKIINFSEKYTPQLLQIIVTQIKSQIKNE